MTPTLEQRKAIYAALAAPFPEEAIERTSKSQTGKGYDTTGIGYQFVVNRLNEVLGVGGWRMTTGEAMVLEVTIKERTWYDVSLDVTVELGEYTSSGSWQPWAHAASPGGHRAPTRADALKGAMTNGFKKAAAFFGPGRQAYEGTLDDDATPAPEASGRPRAAQPPQQRKPAAESKPAAQAAGPANGGKVELATEGQLRLMWETCQARGWTEDGFRERCRTKYGHDPEFLTIVQAREILDAIRQPQGARQREPGED